MKNNTVKKLMREGLAKIGAVPSIKDTWGEHYDLNTKFGLLTVSLQEGAVSGRGSKQIAACYSHFKDLGKLPYADQARVMPSITNGGNHTGKYNWIHYTEPFFNEAEWVDMVLKDIQRILPS